MPERIAILVVADSERIRIPDTAVLEKPKAGVDFPTGLRLALANIHSIEKAIAGLDYPTDGPPSLNRDFYVVVDIFGNRFSLVH